MDRRSDRLASRCSNDAPPETGAEPQEGRRGCTPSGRRGEGLPRSPVRLRSYGDTRRFRRSSTGEQGILSGVRRCGFESRRRLRRVSRPPAVASATTAGGLPNSRLAVTREFASATRGSPKPRRIFQTIFRLKDDRVLGNVRTHVTLSRLRQHLARKRGQTRPFARKMHTDLHTAS